MLINVQADIKNINDAAESLISEVREKACVNDETEYKIRLIVKELLTNVLSYSEADLITIDADIQDSMLVMTMEDNGCGFKHEEVMNRDVTDENFLLYEGGRGIFLVRMMSESIKYNDKGNRVQVCISLG